MAKDFHYYLTKCNAVNNFLQINHELSTRNHRVYNTLYELTFTSHDPILYEYVCGNNIEGRIYKWKSAISSTSSISGMTDCDIRFIPYGSVESYGFKFSPNIVYDDGEYRTYQFTLYLILPTREEEILLKYMKNGGLKEINIKWNDNPLIGIIGDRVQDELILEFDDVYCDRSSEISNIGKKLLSDLDEDVDYINNISKNLGLDFDGDLAYLVKGEYRMNTTITDTIGYKELLKNNYFIFEKSNKIDIKDPESPFWKFNRCINDEYQSLYQFTFVTYNKDLFDSIKINDFSVYQQNLIHVQDDDGTKMITFTKFKPLPINGRLPVKQVTGNITGDTRPVFHVTFYLVFQINSRACEIINEKFLYMPFNIYTSDLGNTLYFKYQDKIKLDHDEVFGTKNLLTDKNLGKPLTIKPLAKDDVEDISAIAGFDFTKYALEKAGYYLCDFKNGSILCRYPFDDDNNYKWRRRMEVKDIKFNDDTMTVMWADGTRTIVNRQPDAEDDIEKALGYAFMKKALSYSGRAKQRNVDNFVEKWTNKREEARRKLQEKREKKEKKKKLNEEKRLKEQKGE